MKLLSIGQSVISITLWTLFLGVSLPAEAQQPSKIYRIGVLRADSPPNLSAETFQRAMGDLG